MRKLTSLLFLLVAICAHSDTANAEADRVPTEIAFVTDMPDGGDLVLGVYEGGQLGPRGQALDDLSQGGLSRAIAALGFEAAALESRVIAGPAGSGFERLLLVGLGAEDEEKQALQWQEIGGNAVQAAVAAFDTAPPMVFDTPADHMADLAFGAKLGSYYFDRYITDDERKKTQPILTLVSLQAEQVQERYLSTLEPVANGVWFARDTSNEPPNVIYPESFVEEWKRHFKKIDGVNIRVFDEKDMKKRGMGAIYGVGQGSKRPPRMMIVEYFGGEAGDAPVVIVGKGITFDSGGISIKRADGMWNMKFDMSGAASTLGALYAVAGRQAKANVVAIVALAENLPGASAQRPSDIVSTLSGKRIEIRNTDAEGRLVLADAIHYGDISYDPALIVDLATLTGSARRALGKHYAALLTRHPELAADFVTAGRRSGEEVWRMPLEDDHFKAVESNVADVVNIGSEGPGLSTAAAFIGSFVRETTPWVHFDIAGVAWADEATPLSASPGSTSFGVRLLDTYIRERFEGQ